MFSGYEYAFFYEGEREGELASATLSINDPAAFARYARICHLYRQLFVIVWLSHLFLCLAYQVVVYAKCIVVNRVCCSTEGK